MRDLEQANSKRRKVEERLPGGEGGGIGSYCLMGTVKFVGDDEEKL